MPHEFGIRYTTDPIVAQASTGWALIRKESLEVARDPSSIAIGVVMPVVLVLLFGYGLSLDIKNVPVAVVMEDSWPTPATWLPVFSSRPISPRMSPPRCPTPGS